MKNGPFSDRFGPNENFHKIFNLKQINYEYFSWYFGKGPFWDYFGHILLRFSQIWFFRNDFYYLGHGCNLIPGSRVFFNLYYRVSTSSWLEIQPKFTRKDLIFQPFFQPKNKFLYDFQPFSALYHMNISPFSSYIVKFDLEFCPHPHPLKVPSPWILKDNENYLS